MKKLFYILALMMCALSSDAQFGTITFNQDTVVIMRRLKILTVQPGSLTDSLFTHKPNGNIGRLNMNQLVLPYNNITGAPNLSLYYPVSNPNGYISSYSETDPIWSSVAALYRTKTQNDILYQPFGNYLTTESDPVWNSVKSQYSTKSIADALYKPIGYVATYAALPDKPLIPTNNNQLTNGAGYITSVSFTGKTTTDLPEGSNLYYSDSRSRNSISLTTANTSGVATYNSTTGVLNVPNYSSSLPWIFNNSPGRSLVSVAASANGYQISATRNSDVSYSVVMTTSISLSGSQAGYIVLEICPTNSSVAADWLETGRFTNAQGGGLVIGLTLTQTSGGQISGSIPAGYYARLRSVNTTGIPTYAYISGQEVLK